MKNIIYFSLLLAFSITSCKKKDTEEETTKEKPVFTFASLVENQIYEFGDTVKIQGTIVAEYDMHGYNVKLFNVASGMNVLNQGYHEHGKSFTVNESWKNTVTDTSQMKIIVDAAIDHEGNLATKEHHRYLLSAAVVYYACRFVIDIVKYSILISLICPYMPYNLSRFHIGMV